MARLGRGQPFKPLHQGLLRQIGSLVLDALAGSYTFSGTASTLTHDSNIVPSAGSYLFTGTAVTFEYDRVFTSSAGSYLWTGTAATLAYDRVFVPDAGSYLWTGKAAGLSRTVVEVSGINSHGVRPRIAGAHGYPGVA